jgi:hypothetical protein
MSKDGRTAACRDCLQERDRQRFPKEREKRAQWSKRYYAGDGKAIVNACKSRWQESNKVKRACHIITGNAIRDGRLIQSPCEVCGKHKVHAHHDDYAKPLEVRWLCALHHRKLHNDKSLRSHAPTPRP